MSMKLTPRKNVSSPFASQEARLAMAFPANEGGSVPSSSGSGAGGNKKLLTPKLQVQLDSYTETIQRERQARERQATNRLAQTFEDRFRRCYQALARIQGKMTVNEARFILLGWARAVLQKTKEVLVPTIVLWRSPVSLERVMARWAALIFSRKALDQRKEAIVRLIHNTSTALLRFTFVAWVSVVKYGKEMRQAREAKRGLFLASLKEKDSRMLRFVLVRWADTVDCCMTTKASERQQVKVVEYMCSLQNSSDMLRLLRGWANHARTFRKLIAEVSASCSRRNVATLRVSFLTWTSIVKDRNKKQHGVISMLFEQQFSAALPLWLTAWREVVVRAKLLVSQRRKAERIMLTAIDNLRHVSLKLSFSNWLRMMETLRMNRHLAEDRNVLADGLFRVFMLRLCFNSWLVPLETRRCQSSSSAKRGIVCFIPDIDRAFKQREGLSALYGCRIDTMKLRLAFSSWQGTSKMACRKEMVRARIQRVLDVTDSQLDVVTMRICMASWAASIAETKISRREGACISQEERFRQRTEGVLDLAGLRPDLMHLWSTFSAWFNVVARAQLAKDVDQQQRQISCEAKQSLWTQRSAEIFAVMDVSLLRSIVTAWAGCVATNRAYQRCERQKSSARMLFLSSAWHLEFITLQLFTRCWWSQVKVENLGNMVVDCDGEAAKLLEYTERLLGTIGTQTRVPVVASCFNSWSVLVAKLKATSKLLKCGEYLIEACASRVGLSILVPLFSCWVAEVHVAFVRQDLQQRAQMLFAIFDTRHGSTSARPFLLTWANTAGAKKMHRVIQEHDLRRMGITDRLLDCIRPREDRVVELSYFVLWARTVDWTKKMSQTVCEEYGRERRTRRLVEDAILGMEDLTRRMLFVSWVNDTFSLVLTGMKPDNSSVQSEKLDKLLESFSSRETSVLLHLFYAAWTTQAQMTRRKNQGISRLERVMQLAAHFTILSSRVDTTAFQLMFLTWVNDTFSLVVATGKRQSNHRRTERIVQLCALSLDDAAMKILFNGWISRLADAKFSRMTASLSKSDSAQLIASLQKSIAESRRAKSYEKQATQIGRLSSVSQAFATWVMMVARTKWSTASADQLITGLQDEIIVSRKIKKHLKRADRLQNLLQKSFLLAAWANIKLQELNRHYYKDVRRSIKFCELDGTTTDLMKQCSHGDGFREDVDAVGEVVYVCDTCGEALPVMPKHSSTNESTSASRDDITGEDSSSCDVPPRVSPLATLGVSLQSALEESSHLNASF